MINNDKPRVIKAEMRNEAKILYYLNANKFKWAPRLFFTGYLDRVFYVNATQLINGKHKKLDEMSAEEKIQLKIAIDQLHKLHILHNDLYPKNIIFAKDEFFIIDFGLAEYCHEKITWKDERSFFIDQQYDDNHE